MTTKTVCVKCHGRGDRGQDVLPEPIDVTVQLSMPSASGPISVAPTDCPYNTGGHGQRCKASHPHQDKVGQGIACTFSFDFPDVAADPTWHTPEELEAVIEELFD